ncbi:MAG: LolA family protein [Planctomycetota bacterium]|jgi:hypothetical protein
MNGTRGVLAALALFAAAGRVRAADGGFKPKKLSREETVALFAKLSAAAKSPGTFQADLHREEEMGFTDDTLESWGRWWVQRLGPDDVKKGGIPLKFHEEITKPRRSGLYITPTDFWAHFPDSKRADHISMAAGLKSRSNTTLATFTLWLYFDLEEIEKRYTVNAVTAAVPEGVAVRKARQAGGKKELSPATPPRQAYRIAFVPKKQEYAPDVAEFAMWVDGENPWPFRTEKETSEGEFIIREFSNIVIGQEIDAEVFEFKRPRGTQVNELAR